MKLATPNNTFSKTMHSKIPRTIIRKVVIYALLGCLWILASHFVLELLVHNPSHLIRIDIYMGILFILLTSALLYLLDSRSFRQLEMSEQSMERFRSIFELAAIGVALVEPLSGYLLGINTKYRDITGYLTEDMLSNRFHDIIHPDDRQIYMDKTARLLAGEIRTFTIEVRLIHKNESIVWANLTVSPYWQEGQEPGSLIAVVEDITKRKMAEASLSLSEESYRTVVEDLTEIICRCNADGTFTFVNDVFCRVFGKSRDELLGSKWHLYTFLDDVPIVEKQLRSLSPANPVVVIENRIYSGAGEICWMQFVNRGFFNKEGLLIEIQAVGRDITERKGLESAIRTSEERLNLALAASKLGVWEWNVQTNRVFWSPECFEIFQVENFDGTHAAFINVVHPDDICRLTDASVQVMTENKDSALEYRIIIPDGQVRWLLGFARSTYDENGRPLRLIGTVRDITERKLAEETLRNNEAQLRHYLGKVRRLSMHMETIREDERAHIARNIHDELGQMLTALHFDLQWLKNRLPESAKECIQKIAEMNGHVTSTKETIHRITADLRPRLLDDLGLVPAMIWQTKEFVRRVGIPCRFNPEGSMDYVTGAHATAIFRILQEALTNVARHSDATMVQVYFRHEGGQTILEIIDNGKGILQEQLDSEQSFGLMGVRERVQMFDGEVEITGQPGKGTTIRVSMPVSRKDALCNEDPYS